MDKFTKKSRWRQYNHDFMMRKSLGGHPVHFLLGIFFGTPLLSGTIQTTSNTSDISMVPAGTLAGTQTSRHFRHFHDNSRHPGRHPDEQALHEQALHGTSRHSNTSRHHQAFLGILVIKNVITKSLLMGTNITWLHRTMNNSHERVMKLYTLL